MVPVIIIALRLCDLTQCPAGLFDRVGGSPASGQRDDQHPQAGANARPCEDGKCG